MGAHQWWSGMGHLLGRRPIPGNSTGCDGQPSQFKSSSHRCFKALLEDMESEDDIEEVEEFEYKDNVMDWLGET